MYYPHDINAQLKHESMETERLDVSLLTILTWKNLFFAEYSTKFIEIQDWLLLICLLRQLSSFDTIIVQMS